MATIDWVRVGHRIAHWRYGKGLSIRQVAAMAQVDKNTVLRLERGCKVRMESFQQICVALGTTTGRQLVELGQPNESYRVSRSEARRWEHTNSVDPMGEQMRLSSGPDRHRLGWEAPVSAFNGFLDCELHNGSLVSSLLEVFGAFPAHRHGGEELVYCIRGKVAVRVGSDEVELDQGDAICFWASEPHSFASTSPVLTGELPPLILSVRSGDQKGKVPRASKFQE